MDRFNDFDIWEDSDADLIDHSRILLAHLGDILFFLLGFLDNNCNRLVCEILV